MRQRLAGAVNPVDASSQSHVDGVLAGAAAQALARPAETGSTINQAILQLRAFLVLTHLTGRGLTDVDVGELGAVSGGDPLGALIRHGQHGARPPHEDATAIGQPAGPVAIAFPMSSAREGSGYAIA